MSLVKNNVFRIAVTMSLVIHAAAMAFFLMKGWVLTPEQVPATEVDYMIIEDPQLIIEEEIIVETQEDIPDITETEEEAVEPETEKIEPPEEIIETQKLEIVEDIEEKVSEKEIPVQRPVEKEIHEEIEEDVILPEKIIEPEEVNEANELTDDEAVERTRSDIAEEKREIAYLEYFDVIRERIRASTSAYARRGHTGKVEAVFTLSEGGNLIKINRINSPNSAILNSKTIKSIRNAAPFPPFPPELKGKPITFSLVIIFQPESS